MIKIINTKTPIANVNSQILDLAYTLGLTLAIEVVNIEMP